MRIIVLCSALFLFSPSCETLGLPEFSAAISTGRIDFIAAELGLPLAALTPQAVEAWFENEVKEDLTVTLTAEGFRVDSPSAVGEAVGILAKIPAGGFTIPTLVIGGIAAISGLTGIFKRRRRLKQLVGPPTPGGAA